MLQALRRTVATVIPAIALLAAAGCGSSTTAAPPGSEAAAPSTTAVATTVPATTTTSTAPPSTTVPKPVGPKPGRTLLVGDSVAFSIAVAVDQASPHGSALGITDLKSKALIACTLSRWATQARSVTGVVSDIKLCTTWPELWKPELASKPDTALLVIGNPGAQELQTPEGEWVRPCDAGYRDRYRADLTDGLAMLQGASNRVAVTTAGYWRPPPSRAAPGVDYRSFDPQTDCLNALIREVAKSAGVPVLEMGAWVCPTADTCRETQDGVTLRPDGIHYDGPGGPIAMQWLLSQLPD